MVLYCSDCGSELIADTGTYETSDWYCPKCDDTFWKRIARQKKLGNVLPEGFVLNYKNFLKMSKDIYNLAQEDKLYDVDKKELTKSNFPGGFFLAMQDGDHYIACKIMIGTKEQIEEAF